MGCLQKRTGIKAQNHRILPYSLASNFKMSCLTMSLKWWNEMIFDWLWWYLFGHCCYIHTLQLFKNPRYIFKNFFIKNLQPKQVIWVFFLNAFSGFICMYRKYVFWGQQLFQTYHVNVNKNFITFLDNNCIFRYLQTLSFLFHQLSNTQFLMLKGLPKTHCSQFSIDESKLTVILKSAEMWKHTSFLIGLDGLIFVLEWMDLKKSKVEYIIIYKT